MERNGKIYGTELLHSVYEAIERRLPPGWEIGIDPAAVQGVDAIFRWRAPNEVGGTMAVEVKDSLEPRLVGAVAAHLRSTGLPGSLAIAPFIGPEARERLARSGCSYADATGNMRIVLDQPAVFIEATGQSKNPWREERPLTSLKGRAAGEVVRAVCDFRPPYGVRELAQRGDLAIGTVSRVLDLLNRDATIERDKRGVVVGVDWMGTIRRWARDYVCLEANHARTYFEPRGLSATLAELAKGQERYAVTGSLAAAKHAPIAPSRLATIYVENADRAARRLGLKRVEKGANVLLVEPRSPVVFERTWTADHLTYAAPSQVAADLLTAPGRGPTEAEALLDWMKDHEDAWRS